MSSHRLQNVLRTWPVSRELPHLDMENVVISFLKQDGARASGYTRAKRSQGYRSSFLEQDSVVLQGRDYTFSTDRLLDY